MHFVCVCVYRAYFKINAPKTQSAVTFLIFLSSLS